jgi:hypothetical protein
MATKTGRWTTWAAVAISEEAIWAAVTSKRRSRAVHTERLLREVNGRRGLKLDRL